MRRGAFYVLDSLLGFPVGFGMILAKGIQRMWQPGSTVLLVGTLLFGCSSSDSQGSMPDLAVQPDLSIQPDLARLAAPDVSFLSPGGALTKLTVPRTTTFTIGTGTSAMIYYTLDGSPPSLGAATTRSGPSPLSIKVGPSNTTLEWFADHGAQYQPESVSSIAVSVDTTNAQNNLGALVENVKFSPSGGPVVRAMPGQMVSGTLDYQTWRSGPTGYCPGCVIQFVVIATTETGSVIVNNGCDANVSSYGTYPGANKQMNFSFTAPQTPGRYLLKYGLTFQFSCDGTKPSGTAAGLIIVQ